MLLAIDTATRVASVALYDASGVAAERTWRSHNNHSVEMAPAVAQMLRQAGTDPAALEAVAVAIGPGSFTGLRIGLSLAKGLCLPHNLPLIGVPTLEITAYAAGDPGGVLYAVLEAGRGRLCVGSYRFCDGLPSALGEAALVPADSWAPVADEPVLVAGEISAALADRLMALPQGEQIAITSLAGSPRRAAYLAELAWNRYQEGGVDDLDTLSPLYAREAGLPAPSEE